MLVTVWVNLYFQRKRLRNVILAVTLIGTGGLYFFWEDAQWALMVLSGEAENYAKANEIIEINGKRYIYTGSTHRIILYEVWREQMESAGLFGHDLQYKLPTGKLHKFWSIDNHYVHSRVKRGLVGLYLFDMLTILTLYRLGRLALASDRYLSPFAGGLFGAVASLALVLFTAALTPEGLSCFYFVVGVAATICSLPEPEPEFDEEDDDASWEESPDWEEQGLEG